MVVQLDPYQSEQISLVWIKFPVTFSESITVMNTVRRSANVSSVERRSSSVWADRAWFRYYRREHADEKRPIRHERTGKCAQESSCDFNINCPSKAFDRRKKEKKKREPSLCWFIFKESINMFLLQLLSVPKVASDSPEPLNSDQVRLNSFLTSLINFLGSLYWSKKKKKKKWLNRFFGATCFAR